MLARNTWNTRYRGLFKAN